jgi:hypothetical protein
MTLLLLLSLALPAAGWSTKEHVQLTRIAAMRLVKSPDTPPAMRDWLVTSTPLLADLSEEKGWFLSTRHGVVPRGVDGLTYWSVMPDLMIGIDGNEKKIDPYGVPERLLHYLDVEFFNADENRRNYRDDLKNKPSADQIPRNLLDERYKRAGMVHFRIEECYLKLVESIRSGRLNDQPGQFPRDEHAARWAGYLAHYVQDVTQPQHSTVDYKSQSYFPNPRKAPNVHAEMEYRLVDDDMSDFPGMREEYWEAFLQELEKLPVGAAQRVDPWLWTVETLLDGYDALPLIGRSAQAAHNPEDGRFDTEKFMRGRGQVRGEEMTVLRLKARRTALAVANTERILLQAWKEATLATAGENQDQHSPISR